jgi:hypothetical protein
MDRPYMLFSFFLVIAPSLPRSPLQTLNHVIDSGLGSVLVRLSAFDFQPLNGKRANEPAMIRLHAFQHSKQRSLCCDLYLNDSANLDRNRYVTGNCI